jgi:F-type H+-transporting ATPase subunit delta
VIDASVARRYARALLALGLEEEREEKFGNELTAVLEALEESRQAAFLLKNPGYSAAQRHLAVEALATVLKLSPTVAKFLSLLVDRQRIGDLAQIARVYGELVDQHAGRVRATVTTAAELSDREVKKLRDAIAEMTGLTIVMDAKTDPSIIGGAVTQVGATQFDGSLRTQLEHMREALKSSPI